jgi:hypothetical protein
MANAAVADVKRKAVSKSLAQYLELLTEEPQLGSGFAQNIVLS